jgi:hypothetical protein
MQWDEAKKQLAHWKSTEALLRKRCISAYFPDPVEGTNKVPLSKGWILKMGHEITRKIDEPLLEENREILTSGYGISLDELIRWKPELNLRAYRNLEGDALNAFDQVLIIKPGSDSLEIVLPASTRK